MRESQTVVGKIWHRFYDWGMTQGERDADYACDRVPNPPPSIYYRGMTVDAPAAAVFPWLCQMRVAPYSYDLLDNLGRKSPPHLISGLTDLKLGQVFMTGFELVEFEMNRHVTIRSRDLPLWLFIFGDVVISYTVRDVSATQSRLLVKMRMGYPTSVLRPFMKMLLPPGDTFMMHKQLRTFKQLAERSYASAA